MHQVGYKGQEKGAGCAGLVCTVHQVGYRKGQVKELVVQVWFAQCIW